MFLENEDWKVLNPTQHPSSLHPLLFSMGYYLSENQDSTLLHCNQSAMRRSQFITLSCKKFIAFRLPDSRTLGTIRNEEHPSDLIQTLHVANCPGIQFPFRAPIVSAIIFPGISWDTNCTIKTLFKGCRPARRERWLEFRPHLSAKARSAPFGTFASLLFLPSRFMNGKRMGCYNYRTLWCPI